MMLFPWGDTSRIERGTDGGVLHQFQPLRNTSLTSLQSPTLVCPRNLVHAHSPLLPASGPLPGYVQPDAEVGAQISPPSPCQASRVLN